MEVSWISGTPGLLRGVHTESAALLSRLLAIVMMYVKLLRCRLRAGVETNPRTPIFSTFRNMAGYDGTVSAFDDRASGGGARKGSRPHPSGCQHSPVNFPLLR